MMICNVIITHQPPEQVERMREYWFSLFPQAGLLIAYGGTLENYELLGFEGKVYVDDSRLRTKDHQRERQSYAGLMKSVSMALEGKPFSHIFLTEFDQIPLRSDLMDLLLEKMKLEDADVLMQWLKRVDGTGSPHYLYHRALAGFDAWLNSFTSRADHRVVLSSVGFGQFWTKKAFDDVAMQEDRVGLYLELWAPTVAHHLGYRVRDIVEQQVYNTMSDDVQGKLDIFKEAGAWFAHPVKKMWDEEILVDGFYKGGIK